VCLSFAFSLLPLGKLINLFRSAFEVPRVSPASLFFRLLNERKKEESKGYCCGAFERALASVWFRRKFQFERQLSQSKVSSLMSLESFKFYHFSFRSFF
jgi:hypothetical protein